MTDPLLALLDAEIARLKAAVVLLRTLEAVRARLLRAGLGRGLEEASSVSGKKDPPATGEAVSPPPKGRAATRGRVAAYLAKHPAATAREIAEAVGQGLTAGAVGYHLTALRKAEQRARR